jgi:hypothetical protein
MPIGTMHARCNCGATVGVCNCLCHEARHGNLFTPAEAKCGYAMRGGTKVYCCYGMYSDVGHSDDCKVAGSSTGGVDSAGAGQPFFDPATIAKAAMTPEMQAAAERGECIKCARPSLTEKRREGAMRWLQCSRCTSVYVLPSGVPETQKGLKP